MSHKVQEDGTLTGESSTEGESVGVGGMAMRGASEKVIVIQVDDMEARQGRRVSRIEHSCEGLSVGDRIDDVVELVASIGIT